MKINILGTTYTILSGNSEKYPILENADGYTDPSVKEIVIDEMKERDEMAQKDIEEYKNLVLRHEIVHAFLHESGLATCSYGSKSWAMNEEMVDWIAIQAPKIFEAYTDAKCI